MKYLVLILLVGCTSEYDSQDKACRTDLENCKLVSESNLRSFHDNCLKLAECMKSDGEVVHFNNQSYNNLYACSIHKKGKTRIKGQYLYPKAELSFGKASSSRLENEITVCEIMTETGNQSDEYYKRLDESFKRLRENNKKEKEASKPLPPMKIREG